MSVEGPPALVNAKKADFAGSDDFYREILDSAIDTAVIGTNTEGRVISWSAGAKHITGWDAAEMLGQPLATIFTPEDRAAGRPAQEMRAAEQSGRANDVRWHLRKDGRRFFAHGSISPLKGPVKGYVKSFRDATVQHETESALKESKERMEFTLTSAQIVGSWDWDILNDRVNADVRFARIHLLDETLAASGAPIAEFVKGIHAADRDRVRSELEHAVETGEPFASEYRLTRPDLSSHYVLARGQCILDAAGKATRFSGVTVDVTERRTSERALLESQELYRSLFNSIDAGFCIVDIEYAPDHQAIDYRFVEVNPAFATNTGLKEVAGKSIRELVPAIEPYWIDIYAQVALTGESSRFENRAEALQDRWYDVYAFRIGDPQLHRVAILFNDITEKKRTELDLRISEARLESALTMAALGTFDWNLRTQTITLSERGRAIFGFKPGENPRSADIIARIYPEDYQRAQAQAVALLATRARRTVEYRVRHPDGSERYVKSVSDVVPGDEVAERYVGVLEDVTEARKAAQRLEQSNATLRQRINIRSLELDQSETRFRAYFDASPEYLYLLRLTADDRLIFEDVNPAGAALYGIPRESILGRTPLDIDSPQDASSVDRESRIALRSRSTRNYETRRSVGARTLIAINTIVSPIETKDGSQLVLVCGRDLTDQRHAEEALRQSQKMEAIGQLTGGIAHDFNNLLAGVMGALELMQKKITLGRFNELDRYVATAQSASKRAAALTHRLLAFSRRQTLSPTLTDVNRLIQSMAELLRRTLGPAVELDVAATEKLWATQVDQSQLESALLNLCINSCDAMPKGGRLTIETANFEVDQRMASEGDLLVGQYVSLSVSDTGVGMTPEIVSRAFDPFFTTKPMGAGTGLGLSMIYGFAKQSGGHVRIYSEEGRGATVCLYLPRARVEGEITASPIVTVAAAAGAQGATALVVDDEESIRMLVVEVLQELGYIALEAGDGPSGMEILRSSAHIDLLVTDVGLPGMNGRQLADAARGLRPELKVLFITGYAENAVINHEYLDSGMQIMTKPFSMETLRTKVQDMIKRSR